MSTEKCDCSSFVLQYEGGCCCGYAAAREVRCRLFGGGINAQVGIKTDKALTEAQKAQVCNGVLRALEDFDREMLK